MSSVRKIVSAVFSLVLLAGVALALIYHQRLIDQVKVWQFTPRSEISQLAARAGFSDDGKFYFYATHPQLESAADFNDDCRRQEANSPLLGCYIQGADRIHIYNIDNAELDGIKEVTAAHEMLHAVYARLSKSERMELGAKLEAAYQRLKTDELTERMEYYERSQPGSRQNELHSILATEFADIGTELEAYYARYFSDRQAVVKLHQTYSSKFAALEKAQSELAADLKERLASINQRVSNYQSSISSLNKRIADFNRRAQNGDFTSYEDFQAERSRLSSEVASLDAEQKSLEQDIATYNADVAKLNELGGKMEQLNKSLDSLQAVGL